MLREEGSQLLNLPEIFLLLELLQLLGGGQTGCPGSSQSSQQASLPLIQQLSLESLGPGQLYRRRVRGLSRHDWLYSREKDEAEEPQVDLTDAASVWPDSLLRVEV